MTQVKHKAYKFRIYPNTEQQTMLARTFGCVRLVYNHSLEAKTKSYEETGKSLSYSKCAADLVAFKKEKTFLREVDSIALHQALRHLLPAPGADTLRSHFAVHQIQKAAP